MYFLSLFIEKKILRCPMPAYGTNKHKYFMAKNKVQKKYKSC